MNAGVVLTFFSLMERSFGDFFKRKHSLLAIKMKARTVVGRWRRACYVTPGRYVIPDLSYYWEGGRE